MLLTRKHPDIFAFRLPVFHKTLLAQAFMYRVVTMCEPLKQGLGPREQLFGIVNLLHREPALNKRSSSRSKTNALTNIVDETNCAAK
jgi:hypothetical protein